MEIIFSRGEATVAEVTSSLPEKLSQNGIRTLINVLESKGHLTRRKDGREYIYAPVVSPEAAAKGVLNNVLDKFFNGSMAKALAARLDGGSAMPDEEEIAELEALIRTAREHNEKEGNS